MPTTAPPTDDADRYRERIKRLLAIQVSLAILVIVISAYVSFSIRPLFTQRAELQRAVDSLSTQAQRLQDSTKQLAETTKQLAETQSELQRGLDAWVQKEVLPLAFIQYAQGMNQSILHDLRVELRRHWIAAAEGQPISRPFTTSNVRYYHKSDAANAEQIARLTDQFFNDRSCPKRVRPLYLPEYNVRPGLVEIWLSGECPR
jgi:hypothetical protein